ncbi:hypothetical protein NP233_g1144 [Leucocoprinus birnbaumii]|uniref:Nephrocystin 3-like N-terminal domain-containing protein n=1 Tax=Leucocoprinus birnbaumii TaxID=56174 RepID=A0AAD5YZU5_9AGAR|nr:hypothetical protein NP233_g1144 [Leucocoprinus birnbaumii]
MSSHLPVVPGLYNYGRNHALTINDPRGAFYGAQHFMVNNPTFVNAHDTQRIEILATAALTAAEYNSAERDPPPNCHPGTRLQISEEIRVLANDPAGTLGLLWVYGPAGVGKSAVMQMIAETCTSILGATFFFFKAKGLTDPRRLFITIAYRLTVQYPRYHGYVMKLLSRDPKVLKRSIKEQFRLCISEPLYRDGVFKDLGRKVLIIIDGLDECEGIDAQCEIISLIGRELARHPKSPLFWVVASRQETHIKGAFADLHRAVYRELDIPMDSDQACRDVEIFLNDRFQQIRRKYARNFSSDETWPSERNFLLITDRARGMFIFAKLVADFVGDHHYADPISQLERVLGVIERSRPSDTNLFQTLDTLYTEILSAVPPEMLPIVLPLIWSLPDSRGWIRSLLIDCCFWGIKQTEAYAAFDKLHSILLIPEPVSAEDENLSPYHKSLIDYFANPLRSGRFTISSDDLQAQAYNQALYILNRSCGIGKLSALDDTTATHLSPPPLATSGFNVERCILSWPPTSDAELKTRWLVLSKALREIIAKPFSDRGCEVFNREIGFEKLSDFFHCVDMGPELFRLSDPLEDDEYGATTIFCRKPLLDSLRSWGLFKAIPLESFDFTAIRQDYKGYAIHKVAAYDEDEDEYTTFPSMFLDLCSESMDAIKELIPSFIEEPDLHIIPSDEVKYADIESMIEELWRRRPLHRIYVLGRGKKACVLMWYVMDDEFVFYFLPYEEPGSASRRAFPILSDSH